jgi:hypothetical protein
MSYACHDVTKHDGPEAKFFIVGALDDAELDGLASFPVPAPIVTTAELRVRAMGSTTHTAWSRGSSRGTAVARDDVGKVDLMMLVDNGDVIYLAELLVFLNYLNMEIVDAWLVLEECLIKHYSR